MVRLCVSAFLIALGFSSVAEAQQRVQSQRPDAPPVQLGVQTQDVTERQTRNCSVNRIWAAHNGLLIDCAQTYMAYDGGSAPGGIAAAMNLLTHAAGRGGSIRVIYVPDPENPICATVQPEPAAPCGRVIAFSAFTAG